MADNIRSLENIGSLFRTADAFAIEKVYLCGISGTPPRPKIAKAALGAETWIPWEYVRSSWRLVERLRSGGFFVVCLEQTEKSVSCVRFRPRFPLALIVGNEVKGVSRSVLERADATISIPMFGRKESLNVAVAFGVAAYEIRRRL